MRKTSAFVIMPFKEEFFEVYELLKERFSDNFEFTHAGDDVNTQQNILKDIVQMIYESDIVIADLTGLNANVFYELGVAHAFGKKVIAISQDLAQLPFDIRSYRATEYSTHFKKFDYLVKELTRYLKGAVDGSVAFGNPVSDFLTTIDKSELTAIFTETTNLDEDSDEKGFIDHLADIEEEMTFITDSLTELTTDMNTMSSGINECTSEINRVSKTNGTGTASFMKKQARKAASYISAYSISLKKHNVIFTEKWTGIENNCLLLLENKHISTPANKEGLVFFLKSLYSMKEASLATGRQSEDFTNSFTGLRGIQSSLNQAVTSLEIDMKQFLGFVEQMCASISRILEKSKFVVGDIDYTVISEDNLGETDDDV